jgi:hypothetical protein
MIHTPWHRGAAMESGSGGVADFLSLQDGRTDTLVKPSGASVEMEEEEGESLEDHLSRHVCVCICMYVCRNMSVWYMRVGIRSIYIYMYNSYIFIYIRLCTRVRVYLCMRVCVYVCMRVRVYECTRVRMYACTRGHVYVRTCVRVYVCMCVCVYLCMRVRMCVRT